MQENLKRVYDYLKKENSLFTIPFEDFQSDMENKDNLKKVHGYLGKINKGFSKTFEEFSADMTIAPETKIADKELETKPIEGIEEQFEPADTTLTHEKIGTLIEPAIPETTRDPDIPFEQSELEAIEEIKKDDQQNLLDSIVGLGKGVGYSIGEKIRALPEQLTLGLSNIVGDTESAEGRLDWWSKLGDIAGEGGEQKEREIEKLQEVVLTKNKMLTGQVSEEDGRLIIGNEEFGKYQKEKPGIVKEMKRQLKWSEIADKYETFEAGATIGAIGAELLELWALNKLTSWAKLGDAMSVGVKGKPPIRAIGKEILVKPKDPTKIVYSGLKGSQLFALKTFLQDLPAVQKGDKSVPEAMVDIMSSYGIGKLFDTAGKIHPKIALKLLKQSPKTAALVSEAVATGIVMGGTMGIDALSQKIKTGDIDIVESIKSAGVIGIFRLLRAPKRIKSTIQAHKYINSVFNKLDRAMGSPGAPQVNDSDYKLFKKLFANHVMSGKGRELEGLTKAEKKRVDYLKQNVVSGPSPEGVKEKPQIADKGKVTPPTETKPTTPIEKGTDVVDFKVEAKKYKTADEFVKNNVDVVAKETEKLFIKRNGEKTEKGTVWEPFGLERIEQYGREYNEEFLKKHPELKDVSIAVYHDAVRGEDLAVIDGDSGKVVEIYDSELKSNLTEIWNDANEKSVETEGEVKELEDVATSIKYVINKYEEGEDNISTVQDILEEVDFILQESDNPPIEIREAIEDYRYSIKEDFEDFGMRGDVEQYENKFIDALNKYIQEVKPEAKDEVFAISGDGMVYHTTAKSAVERIKSEGFKTGKELNISEKRGAIYFSAKDVNEGIYARNREGELYEGEDSATIGINIEGLNLLDITSPEMHKRWSAIKTRGDVDQIPKEYDGTISRLADGRIYEVMLRKDVANSRLTDTIGDVDDAFKDPYDRSLQEDVPTESRIKIKPKSFLRFYKDVEKGIDPSAVDAFDCLVTLEEYYDDYIKWYKGRKIDKAEKRLYDDYVKRLEEIKSALQSSDLKQKIIAIDNGINQWHIDFPVIAHLRMSIDDSIEDNVPMMKAWEEVMGLLTKMKRIPDHSPYVEEEGRPPADEILDAITKQVDIGKDEEVLVYRGITGKEEDKILVTRDRKVAEAHSDIVIEAMVNLRDLESGAEEIAFYDGKVPEGKIGSIEAVTPKDKLKPTTHMTIDEFTDFFAEVNSLLEDKRVDDAHKTLYDMGERMGSINWSELTQADRTSVLDTFSELKDRIDESKEKKIEMVGDKMKEVPIPTYAEQHIPILKELDAKYEGIQELPKGKFISFTDNQTGSTLLVHKDKANKEAFEKKLEESRAKWKESEKIERGEVGRFKNIQQADEFMDRIVQRVYVFSNETETIAKLIENQKDIVKNLKKADREKFDRDLQELVGTNAIYNRMTGNVKAQVQNLNHQINTLERELETNEDPATEKLLSKQYDELEDKVEAIEIRELEKLQSGKDIFKDKTDAPAYDRLIPGVAKQEDMNYEYFEKGREGKVVWMSPDEYFDQVVAGFGKPRKEVIEGMIDTGSMATIGKLIMEGTKIDMPFLDYTSKFGQEGRNRAMALKELGVEKMPVLVMRKVSEKDIEERIRKVRSDILKSADLDKEGYLEEAREKLKEEGYRKDVIDQILDPRSIASQAPKFRKSGKLLPSETETLKEQGTWDQRMVEDQERAQKILSSIDAHIRTHEGIESNSSIIPQIELNDAQKTAMDISEKFFNVPAVWVKNNINAFAGVYQDGHMFLNTKNSDPVGLVVFHEGVHHLKKSDPDLYYELLALFEYSMGMSDISTKDLLRFYKKQGIPKTLEQVVEEALADYVGENRGSQKFWNDFIDKSPNLWQRVWRYFQKLIEKIKTMFDKRVSGLVKNTEQLDKVIKKHFDKVKGVGGKKFEITERQQSKIRAYYTDSEMMSIPEFIKAWHGSRAKHDKFSMKFVGSGEGINAYAWGMYFGGKRGIGEHYRQNLSDHILKRNGKIIKSETEDNTTVAEMFIFTDMREGASRSVILKRIEDFVAVIENRVAKLPETYKKDDEIVKYYENRLKEATSVYEDFKAGKYEIETTGFLYEAELWETGEPELLIWGEQLPETQYQRLTGYLNELINDADIASDKDKSGYWKDVSLYYKGILEALPSTSGSAGAFYNAIADQIGDEKASILLEGAGFDGVQYMAGALSGTKDGTLNYIVFDERAIRILKRNDEPLYFILNPDMVKPTYYSLFERVLKTKFPNKMKSQSVRNFMKKYQVKDAEMDWMGLNDFLEGKESVTKEELQEWFDINKTALEVAGETRSEEESVYRAYVKMLQEKYKEDIKNGKNLIDVISEEEDSKLDRIVALREPELKFEKYTLPGGENHREVLMTIPIKRLSRLPEILTRKEALDILKQGFAITQERNGVFVQNLTSVEALESLDLSDKSVTLKEYLVPQFEKGFTSPHYPDILNMIVEVRTADFQDLKKRDVLIVEEVQSDWAEKGKAEGFETDKIIWRIKNKDKNGYYEVYNNKGYSIKVSAGYKQDGYGALETKEDVLERVSGHRGKELIPDMPFKNDEYMKLGIKKLLRMAVIGEYEGMGLTTGKIQSDRYDLSKHIKRLDIIKDIHPEENLYSIKMFTHEGKENVVPDIKESKLFEYTGRELAEKIIKNKEELQTHEGLDLHVESEGMKSFYDERMLGFVKKYVKQLGGKVTTTQIRVEKYDSRTQAKFGLEPIQTIPYIEITDKLRENILSGQPMFRRSPFKKGDIDAKRTGKETIEGMPKEGLGEEQQEVPSIRLRLDEKDGLEAKERKVKPKKISNVMLNRVEKLYYDAGSVVNFENMLKRNKISRDVALKALEILHDEKRLRPPMPKPVDPVKIKKKRIRGNMPTKKKAEPKVDTVQLPSDFINAYNTPYLHYWSLSTTNDVRFKGYKIGSRSLYSETGKPLDMIWEEVGQGEKELAGHLYRDSEDEMTQGVLDEIDALQTNGTPMQIMERQDDRGAEEAGRTSDVMTDLEYATMSEEVEKFLKDSEELSKKKGDSFVISLMDLQVGDKLEIYNSDLGEFKNVEVVNIDTDNDQIELKASDESYYLDLWGKIRATGAIDFNEPFRTLDKDNKITAKTKDAFGKKLLEFMGAPKPKPSETITKEGVVNNTYPKTTAYDEGYDIRQATGLDGKTRVVLLIGTLRNHDHLSRDIKILKDKGFEVSPTAILTNESKIYNKDTGRWVVVYGVSTPGAVEALKRMTVDYDIIPDGSNPRRVFVYDSDPGLRDASLPIGEAGVVDMIYDPRTHIDFINTRLPEGVEKKVKNIVAQVIEDVFMNNKDMVTWDAEPLIDQAINELMSQNNWDTKISNEKRWAKPIYEFVRESRVEYFINDDGSYGTRYPVIISKAGGEFKFFDSIHDKNLWLDQNNKPYQKAISGLKITDKMRESFFEKKMSMLDKDYSSRSIMQNDPTSGIPVDGYTKVLTLANHYVQRKNIKHLGFTAKTLSGNMVDTQTRFENPRELGVLLQTLKDPRIEHLWFVGIKDNKIAKTMHITSGLPHAITYSTAQFVLQTMPKLRRWISNGTLDSFVMLHNHPGGNPKPSAGDWSYNNFIYSIQMNVNGIDEPMSKYYGGSYINDTDSFSLLLDPKDKEKYYKVSVPANSWNVISEFQFDDDIPSLEMRKYLRMTLKPHEQMNDIYKPTKLPPFKQKPEDKIDEFSENVLDQYATELIENPENVLLVFIDNKMLKAVEAFEYQKLRNMQKEDRRDFITDRMREYGSTGVGMVLDGTVVDVAEIRRSYGDMAPGQDAILGLPSWSDQVIGFVYDSRKALFEYYNQTFLLGRQALRHKIVDRGAIHLEAPKQEPDAISRAYSFIGTAIDSINEMLVFVGENQIRFKRTAKELYRNIQKNKWHITEGATDDEIALLNKSLEHLENIIGVRSTASMKSEASKLKTKTDIREIEYKEFPDEIEINDIHRGRVADIKYQDTRYLSNIFHAWKYLGKSSTKETGLGLLNTMGQKKLVVPMINKLLNKEMMGIDDKVDAYFEPYGGSLVYMLNLDILKKTDKPIYIAVSSKYEPYKALVYKAIKENNRKMIDKLYLGIQGLSDDFVIKKAVSLKAGAINKRAVKNFDSIIKAIQKDNVHIVDMDDQEFFNFVSSEIDKGITPLMFDDSNYAELVGEHSSSAYAGGTIEKDPIFLLNKKLPIFSKIKNAGGVVVVTNHIEPVLTEHLLKQYPDMRSWGYLHQAFTTPDFDYGSHIDGYRPEFIGIIRNNQQGNVLDIREAAGLEKIPIDDVPASRYKSRFYIELNKNMKIDFDRGKMPEKNTLVELQETINHINEIGEYMRHRTETEKKMKKLRGKIYAAIAIKGFNKTEAKKIYKKNTGHNIIKHAEITLSQLDKTLKSIKKKRPVRDYRTKKLVITEKTEKKIKTLKKNLMERGLLTQEVYDQILKINHVKFVGYVTANMFTEEKVAKQILRELNEAVIVSQFSVKAKESLKKFPILEKRVKSLEDIWKEVNVDERGEPVSFDITKGFKTMLDMEHFVDLLEKYSGVEFGRFWRHMRDQWLLAHRKVDVILDRLIELGGGKVKMSKIARDEESIKRIENLVASKLPEYVKGKPTVPKDATESEIKIAKYIAMIGRGFERIVRYERFMRWYDKDGHPDFTIPDAPATELTKAKNILETEGDIELRKFLDTRSWGVIGSGYDFGEIFRGTLRFYRGSPGVSTAHLDPKDTIIYREYDRDIINRFATYVRQMMFRHDLNPIIKGWNLLYKASVDRWKSPAKLKDLLEANVQEMLGHRDIPQAYEKFVFQIYSLIARVTFFHPRLGGRNLLQNVALNPGFVTNFIKAGMENLSSKDREYFKTFVSNNRGIVRDLLYAQYKTDIKGLREIMFVIDEINVMGRTDTINRAASFRSHMSNIMHAIKKYPDYKTSERDRRKFEKEARFYLLTLPQIRHAYEVAATEGNRAMSRYVSWAITAKVHFNYIRALREPASQRTDFRRLLSNLMVFRKGFLQMLILDAQKLKYNKAYESTKATNVVNLAYLFAALALKIAIAGELYKTVFGDEERTPYDPESILIGGNVGGLMYGGVSKVVNFFYSTASLLMAPRYEEEERAKRFLKFEKALSDVGKLAVPLWRLFLQVYEASTGTRNIDKLWIKQIEHRMFPDIKSEPSLEYYFKDRNFIKTIQHAIFGTDWKIEKE